VLIGLVSIAAARPMETLPQLVGYKLPFRPWRRHFVEEAADSSRKFGVALDH